MVTEEGDEADAEHDGSEEQEENVELAHPMQAHLKTDSEHHWACSIWLTNFPYFRAALMLSQHNI